LSDVDGDADIVSSGEALTVGVHEGDEEGGGELEEECFF
jgi:hypothetical protein